jgi:hypothetical protein
MAPAGKRDTRVLLKPLILTARMRWATKIVKVSHPADGPPAFEASKATKLAMDGPRAPPSSATRLK